MDQRSDGHPRIVRGMHGERAVRVIAIAPFLALLLVSVALAQPGQAVYAQTSLKMASPSDLARIANEKNEIEKLIVRGSPSFLDKAAAATSASIYLSETDRKALYGLIEGFRAVLYAERTTLPGLPSSRAPLPAHLNSATLKAGDAVCIAALEEAGAGRILQLPAGLEGNPVAELIPVLALFCSDSRETARLSLAAAERFEKLGLNSAIPPLARAFDAERKGDAVAALAGYRSVLASYPDTWIATLGEGKTLLAQEKYREALTALETIASGHVGDIRFRAFYALALYQNGRFADAEPIMEKALAAADPVPVELTAAMAHMLAFRGEYQRASIFMDAWAKQRPRDKLLFALRTQSALNGVKDGEAVAWARKGLKAYPDDPELLTLAAAALFAGPESGHVEAAAMAEKALAVFSSARKSKVGNPSPLQKMMADIAEGEAGRLLLVEAYRHQDWYRAASLLGKTSGGSLDKNIVSTILRKSGRLDEAVKYSRIWFEESGGSEESADAYLRSLAAATGKGNALVSASGNTDGPSPLSGSLAYAGGAGSAGGANGGFAVAAMTGEGSVPLIDLVLKLMSGSYSSRMKSYLLYLQGSLCSSDAAAEACYRSSLMENADNIDALIALSELYAKRGDLDKAGFYFRQARALGSVDADIQAKMIALAAKVALRQ